MEPTDYARKIDSSGRIVIPTKLREKLSLNTGEIYDFFIHQDKSGKYLCIKCPYDLEKACEEAKELLRKEGYLIP